jgi:hypothetical protein
VNEDCQAGEVCVAEGCVPIVSTDCDQADSIEFVSKNALFARQGMVMGDVQYTPTLYDAMPTDWVEPVTRVRPEVIVTKKDGAPLGGCEVQFLTDDSSGDAFPSVVRTDEVGRAAVTWVAGRASSERLTAAVRRGAGSALTAALKAEVLAHDAAPRSDADAAVVRASTLNLTFPLEPGGTALDVAVVPETLPHHCLVGVVSLEGLLVGLQNSSALDAFAPGAMADERRFLFRSWNAVEGAAITLYADPTLVCATRTDGPECTMPSAFDGPNEVGFRVELVRLKTGESPQADIEPTSAPACESAAGCTDFVVRAANRVLLTYRYARLVEPPLSALLSSPMLRRRRRRAAFSPPSPTFALGPRLSAREA